MEDENTYITDLSPQDLMVIIKTEEEMYIIENKENKEWMNKYLKLKKLKQDLKSQDYFDIENFHKLREFAISKGGFLASEFRRDFYKMILGVDYKKDSKEYELIYIDENKESYEDLDVFKEKKEHFNLEIENKFHHIIDVDVKRSKINMLFKKEGGFGNTNASLKEKLNKFINTMTTLNNQNYNYYQGYHDIGLHFLVLYINNFNTGVSVFQRFSEFYLKENLDQSEGDNSKGYNFAKINHILSDIVTSISPEIMRTIEEMCGQPAFVLSWIITLFTHNIMNSQVQYRLLDYFITSHPLAIYYLTAAILVDEVTSLTRNREFLSLDMDRLDYDSYILKCEEVMKKTPPIMITQKYILEHQFKKFYPILMEETYTEKLIKKKFIEKKSLSKIAKYTVSGVILGIASLLMIKKFWKS